MTVREAADFLDVHVATVRRLISAEKLAFDRVGLGRGKIVIQRAYVDDYLARCHHPAQAPEPRRGRHPGVVVPDIAGELVRRKREREERQRLKSPGRS